MAWAAEGLTETPIEARADLTPFKAVVLEGLKVQEQSVNVGPVVRVARRCLGGLVTGKDELHVGACVCVQGGPKTTMPIGRYLAAAARRNDHGVLKKFAEFLDHVDEDGRTALMGAAGARHVTAVHLYVVVIVAAAATIVACA
jgi:hypothetical protein